MKHNTMMLPKFKRLTRLLGGSVVRAAGTLEVLWRTADTLDRFHFTAEEIEEICEWEGELGALAAMLLDCRWLDQVEGLDGTYKVHDYIENAPEFIQDRHRKRNYHNARKVSEDSGKFRKVPESVGSVRTKAEKTVTDTDTDTDTFLREDIQHKAETEDRGEEQGPCQNSGSGSANLHSHQGPEPVGALLDNLNGGVQRKAAIERKAHEIGKLTRDGPNYHAYWVEVVKKTLEADLLTELDECLHYARSATDPAQQATKGLGDMHSPGKWLVSRMTSLFHAKGIRMPKPPRPHSAARAATA